MINGYKAKVEAQLTNAEAAASYGRTAELRRAVNAGLKAADKLEKLDRPYAHRTKNRFQWLSTYYGGGA